jgi:hypothetical protein
MNIRIVAVGLSLLACGCATPAQKQFQAMQTSNRGNVEQLKACVAEVRSSPEFAPIAAHIPENSTDLTLQQLSDTSLATPEQVQAVNQRRSTTRDQRPITAHIMVE